jgi:hypothetical protein
MDERTRQVVRNLTQEFEKLKGNRQNWDYMWQEIAEHMMPRRADFTVRQTEGEKRREKIFDSTATRAITRFAAGVHNTLTSSAIPWFEIRVDDQLMVQRDVQLWLEDAKRRIGEMFNRPESNFHPAAHELYLDLGAFGTGIMFVEDRLGVGPVFRTLHLGECWLAQNNMGRVDSLYRKYTMNARQLAQEFGEEALPDGVLRSLEKDPYRDFEVLHAVRPRRDRDVFSQLASQKPFASIHFLMSETHILRESGFDEFPFLCPRWTRTTHETYGRGPGTEALPDVKMLNKMEELGLKALAKVVDPPLIAPDDGFLSPIRTYPGGINYYRAGLGSNEIIRPLITGARVDVNESKMAQVRQSIERTFYLDLLELPGPTAADGDVLRFSATEVSARQRDRLSVLGPIVSRMEVEFLGPLVARTASIMVRAGMLPEPPQALLQADFKVSYTNPVGIAQRAGELTSISQLIQFLTPVAQIDPTVLQRMNTGRVVELASDILRVPPSALKTEEEMQQMQQAQQEREMMAMQQQQALAAAQTQELQSNVTKNQAQAERLLAEAT